MRTIATLIFLSIYSLSFSQAGNTIYFDTIAELNDDYQTVEVVALYDNTTLVSKVYHALNTSSDRVDIYLNGDSIYGSRNGMPLDSNQFDTTMVIDSGDTYKVRCWKGGEAVAEITLSADLSASVNKQYFKGLKVYPNPVKDILMVSSDQKINFSYSLKSLDGRQIAQGSFTDKVQIDFNRLSEGVYLFTLCKRGYCMQRKIIKQ